MRDPYEILGVNRSASDAEIKKAFRSLAKSITPIRRVAIRQRRNASRRSPPRTT